MMWLVVNHLLNTHNMVTTTLYLLKDKFRDLYKCKKKKIWPHRDTIHVLKFRDPGFAQQL